jgi:putative oxidoreductase
MAHGFAKLAKAPDAFASILHALVVPAPPLMAWAKIMTEVLGGLAVILGIVCEPGRVAYSSLVWA